MGFYLSQNDKLLNPWTDLIWLLSVDRTGRPSLKSVDRVGRPTCTERARQLGWRAGRPGRSTARELCSLESPGRLGRSTGQRACSLYPGLGRPGWSTAGTTVRNLTVGRSTDRSIWLPTASFSSPINWGFWGLFSLRFVIPHFRNTYLVAYSAFRSYFPIYLPYLSDFNFKYLFLIY